MHFLPVLELFFLKTPKLFIVFLAFYLIKKCLEQKWIEKPWFGAFESSQGMVEIYVPGFMMEEGIFGQVDCSSTKQKKSSWLSKVLSHFPKFPWFPSFCVLNGVSHVLHCEFVWYGTPDYSQQVIAQRHVLLFEVSISCNS